MATAYFRHLMKALKIVLVGDAEVGKTWLVARAKELYATLHDYYSLKKEPFDCHLVYSPTVFETCFSNIDTTLLGNYQTNIWDTGGSAIFDLQRPLAYIRADVFMLCFDISNRESFLSVTERWLPEIQKYEPDAPVLIVGTKADLRDESASTGECYDQLVSLCEAQRLAEKLGVMYQEVSAQTGDHVADAFQAAVKLGHTRRNQQGKQSQKWNNKDSFDPTWIPPMKSPPEIKIDPSTYSSDFKKVMDDTASADVLFQFEDGSPSLHAHKIMLLLTPSIFKDALLDANCNNMENFRDLFELTEIPEDSNELAVLDDSHLKACTQVRTCILLKNWIFQETFLKVLEFFYTGEADISKDTDLNKVKEILAASEKLNVQPLVEDCNYFLKPDNAKKDDTQKGENSDHSDKKLVPPPPPPLRPSIVNDLFLDLQATTFSDVTFLVEDTLIRAHKAIVTARSPYIAALLSGNFKDVESTQVHLHGINCQSFLAVLEYLYTDSCPSLEKVPVEEVLIVADKLCLFRLVQICEVHMQKELQKVITQKSSHVANEFMDTLAFSKVFNAKQLTKCCLHFMAFNFKYFQGIGNELNSVVKENKEFFEEHRWPPQEYAQALEKYKRSTFRKRRHVRRKSVSCLPSRCSVM